MFRPLQCLSADGVYSLSRLNERQGVAELSTLSAILLHLLENGPCSTDQDVVHQRHHTPPTTAEGMYS